MITTATLPTTIRGLIAEGLIALDTDDGVEGYSVADFIAADIDAEYPDGLAAARAAALGYLGPDCFGVGLTFALLDDLIVLYHDPISRPGEWVAGPRGGGISDPVAYVAESLGLRAPDVIVRAARAERLIADLRAIYGGRVTDDLLDALDLTRAERALLCEAEDTSLAGLEAAIRSATR